MFRIYYGDGTTYNGDPFYAPPANAQVIAQEVNGEVVLSVGERETKGSWWWDGEHWRICDSAGLWDYLLMYQGPKAVLFGRTLRDQTFWEILERAKREGLGR